MSYRIEDGFEMREDDVKNKNKNGAGKNEIVNK